MITFFCICLIIGAIAGFLAGLFGIGGGLIIVPTMLYLLPMVDVPEQLLMPTALGTSFATIVITSFSSAHRHYKLGNLDFSAVKVLIPVLMLSAFITAQFASKLPSQYASKIFACLVIYLAIKMVLSIKPQTIAKKLTALNSAIAGLLIGFASAFAGIGGGAFIVPFLNSRGIAMQKAIGSSALGGALLGLSGMLSYMFSGWNIERLPDYSLGYVYLPAVLAITFTSFFTTKFGANTVAKLPVATLKRYFAAMLIVIAINIFMK